MVAKQLARLSRGEVVTLSASWWTVCATTACGQDSLVRDDTGAGACEVLL